MTFKFKSLGKIRMLVFPVEAMEEELCGEAGALLFDGGGVFVVTSLLEVAVEEGGGAEGRVLAEGAHDVHEVVRPTEKLVFAMACGSCTSRSALQARWNKRVMLVYSLYSKMV